MSAIPKLVMLKKADEFSSAFSFRKRYTADFLIAHYMPNQNLGVRIGFVVAKKVAKLAVDRNYMRRVLRELCRQEQHGLSNVDVIIQVTKPFKNNHFDVLKQEIVYLFVKIQKKLISKQISHA